MRRLALGVFCALSLATQASAQSRSCMSACARIPTSSIPHSARPMSGASCSAGMCDKLFDIDAKLNIVPQLATGYEWKDPTHLVIHIRDGVQFQDGEKLDAEAVKYKLMRDLTIKGSMRRGEVSSIDSIDVIDPLTVQLNLKAPASQLLAQLTDRAGIMISPKAAEAAGDKFGLHPVCAGPFSFDSRVAQDRIVLKRFPGYWDAKDIHFDEVVYLPNPNCLGAAGEFAGRRAGYRRIHPADRCARGAARSEADDRDRRFAGLYRHHHQHRQRSGAEHDPRQERAGAPGVRACDRSRRR